jgi:hypothetical protein
MGQYSTSLLDLICCAGVNKPSCRVASLDLHKTAGSVVHEKQVERLNKRIGSERLAERHLQVAHFLALPLAERCDGVLDAVQPLGPEQVALLMADADMLELGDPGGNPAQARQPDRPREGSSCHLPRPPASGQDRAQTVEIGGLVALEPQQTSEPETSASADEEQEDIAEYEGPTLEKRQMPTSRQS